jgi:hypothetical protein
MRLAFVLLLAAVATAGALAGTARADGDPASDYLLGQQVFLPFDAKIPVSKQREAINTLASVNRAGYKIRAAIIWSSYDLGAITSLWRKPRTYARFLGLELKFVYKQRLLIVMPNGFGFFWNGHPTTREYAVLSKIPTGRSGVQLVDAAEKAVVALAAANGVKVDARVGKAPSRNHQRLFILLVAILVVAVAVVLRVVLRKRA